MELDDCGSITSPVTGIEESAFHENTDGISLLNETLNVSLLQMVIGAIVLTCGDGFTLIVKVTGLPGQEIPDPINVGVTNNVACVAIEVVFNATNGAILPIPETGNPIVESELVQLKVVALPLKLMALVWD
jgi:hypothetical protein